MSEETAATIMEVDLEKMAEETKITVEMINWAFDLSPLPSIEEFTVVEAKNAFQSAPTGSEAAIEALTRWQKLCLKEIARADSVEKIQMVFNNAPNDIIEYKALEKWLELATTLDEIRVVCYAAPPNSKVGKQALERWDKVMLKRLAQAASIDEFMEILGDAPANSKTNAKALEKLNELWLRKVRNAHTVEAISEIFEDVPSGSEAEKETMKKWNELSLKEVAKADSVEEIIEVFENAQQESEAKKRALEKWNELSLKKIAQTITLDEIFEVFGNTPENSEAETKALEKLFELTTTTTEIKRVWDFARGTVVETKALEKWKKLAFELLAQADSVVAIKAAYDSAPPVAIDGEVKKAAIRRLANFFPKK